MLKILCRVQRNKNEIARNLNSMFKSMMPTTQYILQNIAFNKITLSFIINTEKAYNIFNTIM